MWRLTVIPTIDFSDEEPSVEPYSDAKCRKANHDRVADNHARPKVLRICGASHDHVRTQLHYHETQDHFSSRR